MKLVDTFLKKDFKYMYKENRLHIHHIHLTFEMDSDRYNLQANLDFQDKWLDVLVFISPSIQRMAENYWESLQTINYVNWYVKSGGRFYIDSYGDLAYSVRLKYDFLVKEPSMVLREIESAVDYYADLFIVFVNVCEGRATFEETKQVIDDLYNMGE